MKYRKRPVVIEAEQYDGTQESAVRLGLTEKHHGISAWKVIETLEGPHLVTPGDFIITGVKGERYACKPDIFHMTYEAVEPDALANPRGGGEEKIITDDCALDESDGVGI